MIARRSCGIWLLAHRQKCFAAEIDSLNNRQLAGRHCRALLPRGPADRSVNAALPAPRPGLHRHKTPIAVGHTTHAINRRGVQISSRPTLSIGRAIEGVPHGDEESCAIGDIIYRYANITFSPGIKLVRVNKANTEQSYE